MAKAADSILLVDSHALIHRAYHAFPQTLTTKEGELVNAVYGFTSLLLQVLEKLKPLYVVCVFDAPGKTFRHDKFKEYKGTRKEVDASLISQFPKVHEVTEALGMPTLSIKGYEADDLIGTLAKSPELKGIKKIIMTGDRDLLQLVDPEINVYLAGGSLSQAAMLDVAGTEAKLGFKPELLIDFKALRGDASDNIPGVRGIGDKTATGLVAKYGNLDQVYEHLAELKPAVKNKLEREIEILSRELATIATDVKFDFKLEKAVLSDYDTVKAAELFRKYQFKSLLNKLPKSTRAVSTQPGGQQQLAFQEDTRLTQKGKSFNAGNFAELIKQIADKKELALRFSDCREDIFAWPKFLAIADADAACLLDLNELAPKDLQTLGKTLRSKVLIGHDCKFDIQALLTLGIDKTEFAFDIMLAAYVLFMGSGKFDLSTLAFNSMGAVVSSDGDVLKEALLCWQLYQHFRKDFNEFKQDREWNPRKLFIEIEMKLVRALALMERYGVKLDPEYLMQFKKELEKRLIKTEKEIYKYVGHEFNIGSPKQLGEVLFDELKLPGAKKNKSGGFSTNERVLTKFRVAYPIIDMILDYREVSKLKSTYTDALVNQINKNSGRVHTNYRQSVAATGRLSSNNPNLQNIPISTDLGQKIREAFVSSKGKLFVSFDYSQQELRILAHISNEDKLKEAFNKEIDIHALTASQLYGKKVEEVDKNERRVGKTVNFGVVYGISAFGLSDRLDLQRGDAQAFIDQFYASYPNVRTYFDNLLKQAKEDGFVSTLFGRRKNTSGLDVTNLPAGRQGWQLRAALEREIINFPLQGSAADMMKLAMISTQELIEKKYAGYASMTLQIHDELVFEVAEMNSKSARLKDFVHDVREIMLKVAQLSVIMKVSVETGKNLGDMSDY